MRDINRIEPFLDKFKELWLKHPDLRFGQLICILEAKMSNDQFFIEEEKWLELIQKEIDE